MSKCHPDKLLLCLRDRNSTFYTDAELPADMLISDLRLGLVRLLSNCEGARYGLCRDLTLWYKEKKLQDDQTLASLGIWDGNELVFQVAVTAFEKNMEKGASA